MNDFSAAVRFQVTPFDPFVYIFVVVVFGITGVLACLIPSVRAARIDPQIALRPE